MTQEIVFDAGLVSGDPDDHERLAKELAEFMLADTSAPETGGDRESWASDRLFREQLEADVVQRGDRKDDLVNLADICKRARAMENLSASPASRVLLLIAGIFNPLRRLIPPDIPMLRNMIRQATKEVEALPKSTRKLRLNSLLEYNLGIYFRDVDVVYEFSKAAQEKSAIMAKRSGDEIGEAIARFCMAYDSVSLALQKGEKKRYPYLIRHLREKGKSLCETFTDRTSTERTWKHLNVPVHVITSIFWANMKCKPETLRYFLDLLEQLPKVDSRLSDEFQFRMIVFPAICDFILGDTESAMDKIRGISIEHIQINTTVQLMTARAMVQNNNIDGARFYRRILKGDHSMEQIRAVASRELDKFLGMD